MEQVQLQFTGKKSTKTAYPRKPTRCFHCDMFYNVLNVLINYSVMQKIYKNTHHLDYVLHFMTIDYLIVYRDILTHFLQWSEILLALQNSLKAGSPC